MWRLVESLGLWEVDHGLAVWSEDGSYTNLTPCGMALYLAISLAGFCLACWFEGNAYLG